MSRSNKRERKQDESQDIDMRSLLLVDGHFDVHDRKKKEKKNAWRKDFLLGEDE
jgi:hypothetical protein